MFLSHHDVTIALDKLYVRRLCEYVIPPQLYSAQCVGPKAVARRELERVLLATEVAVETSVSLQYGSMKRMLMHHPENSEVEYLIRRIQALRNQAGALSPGSETRAGLMQEMNERLCAARWDPNSLTVFAIH